LFLLIIFLLCRGFWPCEAFLTLFRAAKLVKKNDICKHFVKKMCKTAYFYLKDKKELYIDKKESAVDALSGVK